MTLQAGLTSRPSRFCCAPSLEDTIWVWQARYQLLILTLKIGVEMVCIQGFFMLSWSVFCISHINMKQFFNDRSTSIHWEIGVAHLAVALCEEQKAFLLLGR